MTRNSAPHTNPDDYIFEVPPDEFVVLDFDGQFTDCEPRDEDGTHPYEERAISYIADHILQTDRSWVAGAFAAKLQLIREDPEEYGMRNGGVIVAPGLADPYLRCGSVAEMIFDQLSVFTGLTQRRTIISEIYNACYPKFTPPFRPGADHLLRHINHPNSRVRIVTNSKTDHVERRVREVCESVSNDLVHGLARKFDLDHDGSLYGWEPDFPVSFRVPGMTKREVYVRRPHYLKLVHGLLEQHDASPQRLTVAGDIWELDLAMWQQRGAHIICFENENTPSYLRTWFSTQQNAHMVTSLAELVQILRTPW